jgi:hypothetical protein
MIDKMKSTALFGDHAMRRFRFHIGTLLLTVLLVGVGFAALRESNETWDGSIFSITLGVLLISIMLAIHRTEKRRAFWLGFALFGLAYLGFSLVPSIEPRLITKKALVFLDSKIPRSVPIGFTYFEYGENSMDLSVVNDSQSSALHFNKGNVTLYDVTAVSGSNPNIVVGPALVGSIGTTEHFVRIGHSLLALIAALLGGQLSRRLYAGNRERTSEPSSPQPRTEPIEHLTDQANEIVRGGVPENHPLGQGIWHG